MSQLKVNAIRATAASSDSITLASNGKCAVTGSTITADTGKFTNLPNRNIIINGAFQVWQRGTSSNLVGFRTADRWKTTFTGTHEDPTRSKLVLTSSDTGPWAEGFRNAYRITNGNQTSVEAGDTTKIEYAVEDYDLANSGWQAESTSSYLTMSFWLRSSVAQTYYVILETKHGTSKQYSFAATISSANTWTKITKTVPGHADISFGNDNGEGMDIYICPFVGTNESTSGHTLNSWKNTNGSDQVPDMTNTWYDTDDATFDLTGVQLEVGDYSSSFEFRSYSDELARCQRYYQVLVEGNSKYFGTAGAWYAASAAYQPISFPVEMRAAPSAEFATGTDYYYVTSNGTNDGTTRPAAWSGGHVRGGSLYYQGGQYDLSNGTAGHAFFTSTNHVSAKIAFEAEL